MEFKNMSPGKQEIISFSVLFAVIISMLPVASYLFSLEHKRRAFQTVAKVPESGIYVQLDVNVVDPLKYNFNGYVSFKPFGSYAAKSFGPFDDLSSKSSLVPSRAMRFYLNGKEYKFPANVPIAGQTVTLMLTDGDTFYYPFDECMSPSPF